VLLKDFEKVIKERGAKRITAIEIRTFEGFWKKLGFTIDEYGMTATKNI
jgi:hypothetical protein